MGLLSKIKLSAFFKNKKNRAGDGDSVNSKSAAVQQLHAPVIRRTAISCRSAIESNHWTEAYSYLYSLQQQFEQMEPGQQNFADSIKIVLELMRLKYYPEAAVVYKGVYNRIIRQFKM